MPCLYHRVYVRKSKGSDGKERNNFYFQEVITVTRRTELKISNKLRDSLEPALLSAVESGHPVPLQVGDSQEETYKDSKGVERSKLVCWLNDLPE